MTEGDRAAVAIAAASLLGVAMVTGRQWVGVALLVPVLALAALAALGKRDLRSVRSTRHDRIFVIGFWLGLALFARALLKALDVGVPSQALLVLFGVVVVGGAAFSVIVQQRGNRAFLAFLGSYLFVALAILAITRGDLPNIDVVMFQQDASQALSDGVNPYDIRFPDLYSEARSDQFYGPGVSEDGVLQFGYPYLPLSLLVVAPFELIFGDFRIAHALALVGAAFVMSRIRPGHGSRSIAVLFLLTSPVLLIVTFGWIEPLLILGSALVVLAASRQDKATSYLTGVLLSLKQYVVLLVPVSLLLLTRPFKFGDVVRHLLRAGLVVVATVLPFFLWNPGEFTWSVVELQFVQPFRHDSLSFMAAWAAVAGEPAQLVASLVPLLLAGAVSVAALYRSPTGSQGFSLAAGLTFLVSFAFSKQAFPNYYILVMALLFLGAAAGQPQESQPSAVKSDHEPAPANGPRPSTIA